MKTLATITLVSTALLASCAATRPEKIDMEKTMQEFMMLGVPGDEHKALAKQVGRWKTTMLHRDGPDSEWQKMEATGDLGNEQFAAYIDWRAEHPSDDLITELMHATFTDPTGTERTLTRDELLTYITVIVGAGNETTNRLIGWMGKLLADHPDQRRELVEDRDLIPAAVAQTDQTFEIPGKEGLIILNDRPVNAETPAHLLDDPVTPASRLFVRNNGIPPFTDDIDPLDWTLDIEGESCERPQSMTLRDLQRRYKHHTLQLQIECGGNGRSEFLPPARGNQWTTGAIGCPEWTGVRLAEVLDHVGVADDAVYVAYEGDDTHLSGDPTKRPISRGVPLRKAMERESMLVWAMNGEPLPPLHGYPLRMLCPGWPASVSGKWLTKLLIRVERRVFRARV